MSPSTSLFAVARNTTSSPGRTFFIQLAWQVGNTLEGQLLEACDGEEDSGFGFEWTEPLHFENAHHRDRSLVAYTMSAQHQALGSMETNGASDGVQVFCHNYLNSFAALPSNIGYFGPPQVHPNI